MTSRTWLCRGLILALCAACGKGGGGEGGKGKAGTNAPVAKAFKCFDLPGASRSNVTVAPDGKRIVYTESRHDADGHQLYDVAAVDIATGQPQPLVQDVSQPDWLDGQPIFLRATEKTGEWYEWKRQLFINGKPVSQAGEEVVRFVIDRATGTVYYATYRYNREEKDRAKAVQHVLWKVPHGSTTPEKVRDGVAPHAIVDGGKALLVVVTSDEKGPLAKLSLAGGEPTVLVPDGVLDDAVIGDKLVYLPNLAKDKDNDKDKGQEVQLMVIPLAGGAATVLPGSTPSSRLLGDRDHALIIERPKDGAPEAKISKTDGAAPLRALAELAGVDVESAALLPDGLTLAATIVHDTNADGKFDYADEADICLIPTSATPALPQKLTPETRKVPKRLAAIWPQIEAKAKDLGGSPRYLDDHGTTAILIDAAGDGPATLDEMAKKVREAATAFGALAKEPTLGLVVKWKANNRTASMVWSPEQKKLVGRVGAYGQIVTTKEDYMLSTLPRYGQKVDYMAKLPYETQCSGTVTNLGTAPTPIDVECRAFGFDGGANPKPEVTKKTTIANVAPGATAKYTIDLGRSRLGATRVEQHFFIAGADMQYFNEFAWSEVTDWTATADRVKAATGYSLVTEDDSLSIRSRHYDPEMAVGAEFATLDAAKQQAAVKTMWTEWSGHWKRLHPGDRLYSVKLKDGSVLGRTIEGGKLQAPR